jgi:hypothetical protein
MAQSMSQMPQVTQGMSTGSGMMPGGMGSMMFSPVVGPDGTVYLLKTKVTPGSAGMMGGTATAVKTQLVAIAAGSVVWTIDLDGWMISRPVITPDGNIVLTESFPPDFVFGLSGTQANSKDQNAKLLIIKPTANPPQIVAQKQVEVDALSQPAIVTLADGSYQILAQGFDMGGMMDAFYNGRSSTSQQQSLYLFDASANLLTEVTP